MHPSNPSSTSNNNSHSTSSCPHHSRALHRTRGREKTPQAPVPAAQAAVLAAILRAPKLQKVTGKHRPLLSSRGNHRNSHCPSRGPHSLPRPQPSPSPVSSKTTSVLLAASCFTSLTTSRAQSAFSSSGSTPMEETGLIMSPSRPIHPQRSHGMLSQLEDKGSTSSERITMCL